MVSDSRSEIACFVVGCGSIGRRHIGNLRTLGVETIAAYDVDATRLAGVAAEHGVTRCASVENGVTSGVDLVLVCTPPDSHLEIARQAIEAGCHVFVEKPLANTSDGTPELLSEAARRGKIVYVGYNLRFHPGLRRLKRLLDDRVIGRVLSIRAEFGQYLPDWRPSQDYRENYTAHAARAGGVIFDCSHELDYVRWLVGEVESVWCRAGQLSSLEMDAPDTAEITLSMCGGAIAQIHVDCTQRAYTRECKIIGETGVLTWDYAAGIRRYEISREGWRFEAISSEPNETYLDEMAHVLACARGEETPLVDGATGERVLSIALASRESAALRREVRV